jgi:hypothetical protein
MDGGRTNAQGFYNCNTLQYRLAYINHSKTFAARKRLQPPTLLQAEWLDN